VGDSMAPTLAAGTVVVGVRPRGIKLGDIVVVWHDGLDKIKRVKDITLDRVFIVGDNPAESTDSRHFGWIPRDTIIARVVWYGSL
jgi:phage repressor protein C with HTH and peptisase S24 domain